MSQSRKDDRIKEIQTDYEYRDPQTDAVTFAVDMTDLFKNKLQFNESDSVLYIGESFIDWKRGETACVTMLSQLSTVVAQFGYGASLQLPLTLKNWGEKRCSERALTIWDFTRFQVQC